MKKILSVILAATVLVLTLIPVLCVNAEEKLTFGIGEITGIAPGAIIEVPVTIKNNPGIAVVGITLNYSSNLTFIDPEDEEEGYDIETLSCPKGKKTIRFQATLGDFIQGSQSILLLDGDDDVDITGDGNLVVLMFKVAETAKLGDTFTVSVSVNDDGKPVNLSEQKLSYDIEDPFVYELRCINHVWGDGTVTPHLCDEEGEIVYKCKTPGCTGKKEKPYLQPTT